MLKSVTELRLPQKRETTQLAFPSRRAVSLFMGGAIAFLSTCGVAAATWIHFRGLTYYDTLVSFFNVDDENNLPTWYSGLSLAFCAALLFAVAATARREKRLYTLHWQSLSWIFLLLSLDEISSIHERVGKVATRLLHIDAGLHFAWVLVIAPLVVIVGASYMRFLLNLPLKVRRQFVIAGAVYISGALFMELIGGNYVSRNSADLGYYLIVNFEELLEMLGVLLFVRALMDYLSDHQGIILRLQTDDPPQHRYGLH